VCCIASGSDNLHIDISLENCLSCFASMVNFPDWNTRGWGEGRSLSRSYVSLASKARMMLCPSRCRCSIQACKSRTSCLLGADREKFYCWWWRRDSSLICCWKNGPSPEVIDALYAVIIVTFLSPLPRRVAHVHLPKPKGSSPVPIIRYTQLLHTAVTVPPGW